LVLLRRGAARRRHCRDNVAAECGVVYLKMCGGFTKSLCV